MKTLRLLQSTSALLCLLVSLHAVAADGPQHKPMLHDPTQPLATPARKPAAEAQAASPPPRLPQLQMVLISEQRRLAMIDDELVAEGESVKGVRVLSIRKEAVIIATPKGPRTLPLAADIE